MNKIDHRKVGVGSSKNEDQATLAYTVVAMNGKKRKPQPNRQTMPLTRGQVWVCIHDFKSIGKGGNT